MNGLQLRGLDGTNPLGFLAALGIQVAYAGQKDQPRLWWSGGVIPYATIDQKFTVDEVVKQAQRVFEEWKNSPAMKPNIKKGDELKLAADDIRKYLKDAQKEGGGSLACALLAEGSLDRSGKSKPSDLYFSAGQQKFLEIARNILNHVTDADIHTGLCGPWKYDNCELSSLKWDIADERIYALMAENPSDRKKRINPGPEALAVLGLSMHPVFPGKKGTLTQGCSGKWKCGYYSWPIWDRPTTINVTRSLLAHSFYKPAVGERSKKRNVGTHFKSKRAKWFDSWGITKIMGAPIRRTKEGGYGTFGPAEVIWSNSQTTRI